MGFNLNGVASWKSAATDQTAFRHFILPVSDLIATFCPPDTLIMQDYTSVGVVALSSRPSGTDTIAMPTVLPAVVHGR